MSIEQLIIEGKKIIHTNEAKLLLSFLLNYDVLELLNHLDEKVSTENVKKYYEMIRKVKEGYPLQYVIGSVNFFGLEYIINENVLIPRFETEELVENTINYINKFFGSNINVIDLGCGSGVIGLTLKNKLPNIKVDCLDISEDVLNIAKMNATKLNLDVNFIKGNMLNDVHTKYDVIISNPPYIGKNEIIDEKVSKYEPKIALYAELDGIQFYDQILSIAKKVLKDKYLIAFEIGMNQRNSVYELAKKYLVDFQFECKKDLSGRDRMIFIYNI